MQYEGNVKVTVITNGEEKPSELFENEYVDFTSIDGLWIRNLANNESNLIETFKMWHEMDKKTHLTSQFIIEPENPAFVRRSFKYVIRTINEQKDALFLEYVLE